MRSTKVIHKDGDIFVWCPNHQGYEHHSEFYYWPSQRQKYSNHCKVCSRKGQKVLRSMEYDGLTPREKKTLTEKKLSEQVLLSLGYDLNNNIPVYKQFEIRHNLS